MRLVGCLSILFTVGLASMPVMSALDQSEDAKLTELFKKYLDEQFHQRPYLATRLGDHRFDDRLVDLSPKARADWVALARRFLDDLPHRVDYQKLSRDSQIDFDIFKNDLTRTIWHGENTHPFENDPRTYSEYISDSIFLLLTQSSLPKAQNVHHAAVRITQIPRIVATAMETLTNPPPVFVDTAIRQNRGAISFYEGGIFEVAGETPHVSELAPVLAPVAAALRNYQKYLQEDLLPRSHGVWKFGSDRFARKFDLDMNAGLSAADVYREAKQEFDRVRRDMYVIARQLWAQRYPQRPLPPEDAEGRQQTIRQVLAQLNQQHGTVDNLVADARDIVSRVKTFISEKDLLRLPQPDRCQVIEMPEFQRGNTVAYLNPAPPLDPNAASVYAISPPPRDWTPSQVKSYLEEYNRYLLQILTIHEGYPGHYVQLDYSNRNPSLIRKVLYSGAFAEGWAVYGEQMMLDQGYGNGDPALRLNQLKWYLRSVTNAILDHDMHCTPMTDQQAYDFLTKEAFQTEGEALGKITRSKQNPCQLSEYFVGRTAFHRLRQAIQREQGSAFDLGRYHEAVLAHGTLPVKYLPELARARLKQPR